MSPTSDAARDHLARMRAELASIRANGCDHAATTCADCRHADRETTNRDHRGSESATTTTKENA